MGLADDIDAWLGGAKKMWAGCSSFAAPIEYVNTWCGGCVGRSMEKWQIMVGWIIMVGMEDFVRNGRMW